MDFKINNTAQPMATYPKVRGLHLVPKLTYNIPIHNISVDAHKPLTNNTNTHRNSMGQTGRDTYGYVCSMPLPYGRLFHNTYYILFVTIINM